ncbi:YcxB family protein [Pinisolibacter sp.]|uniref:YcxB family protein n=1 Tax=Pinisolibacter sp. TaxID=2172024 RepID=UPI002FDF07A9
MSEKISFPFARADWVALSTAVARRPLPFRIALVVFVLGFAVIVLGLVPGNAPTGGSLLGEALKGGSEWYPWYGFGVLLSLGLFFRHHLVGFNAATGFARMPLAEKELTVEFADEEIHATATDFDWRFPWAAVVRLIETPTHLVLATGGRQGLPIPRTAFADADAFERTRAHILAHLSEGTPHDRA